jgi:hypothetical protein
MSGKNPSVTTFDANIQMDIADNRGPKGAVERASKRHRRVTFRESEIKTEDDKVEELRGTSGRDLTSSHDLFFDVPDYKGMPGHQSRFSHHFVLHWRSFFSLFIEIFIIVFRFVWGVFLLFCRLIWLLLKSICQIVMCVLLGIYFVLTSCIPGSDNIFELNTQSVQDLRAIRWKNIHQLFLFLRIEPLNLQQSPLAGLKDGVPKFLATRELTKLVPVKNLRRVIREVSLSVLKLLPCGAVHLHR